MAPLVPGQSFGAFAIEREVGVGGMGVVYLARDTARGRLVALKVLRSRDGAPPTDEERARFVREARLAARLVHPNIVSIVASGAIGTVPFIAMEWIDGVTLAERLADPGFGGAARLEVLAGIAAALAHAHRSGVVHRDLKPSNVMLDPRGQPRLVDFGIAKQSRDASQPFALAHTEAGIPIATREGVLLGTPSFMAPEQMFSPEVDARADQYAWGVLAYVLLAGVHPRETVAAGDAPFPVGRARPLAWQAPGVPEAVAAVVHRAMAYEREARFRDMDEAGAALAAARSAPTGVVPTFAGAGSEPTGPALLGSTPGLAPSPPTTMQGVVGRASLAAPAAPPPKARANRPALVAGLAVAGVLGVLGLFVAARLATGAPPPVPLPGYRTIEMVRSMDDVPFAGGAAGASAAKHEIEKRLRPCIDTRMLADDAIQIEIMVGVSGNVTHVEPPNYCRRERGTRYLCTFLGDPVKRDHPTPPPGMLECLRDAAKKMSLPPLVSKRTERWEPAEPPEPVKIDLDLEAR